MQKKGFFAEASANQLRSFGPRAGWGFVGILLYFRARVYPRSGRCSGDPSGRGHAIVPRGRTRSVLPARASLAHSDPLVVSSIAFCRALHRVRRSWGRYNRPQEWTLGSEPRVVAVKPRAALLLPDGTSCLVYSSVSVLCRQLPYATEVKTCSIAVPVGSGLITVKTSNFVFRQSTSQLHLSTIVLASAVAVPVVSFSLEAKICTIAVPVGSGLITVKLQISLLLVLVHGRPCSIVYICRSISNVDIVRSGCSHLRAGTYAGQFDSKLPSCALEPSCIQITFLLACLLFCCCMYVS